jgi:hypothetical protein
MCKHLGLRVQVSVSEDGSIQFNRYLSRRGISLLRNKENIWSLSGSERLG